MKSCGMIRFVRFNRCGTLLAYGGMGPEVCIVCTTTWKRIRVEQTGNEAMTLFGEFSPDDRYFVYGGEYSTLNILEVPPAKEQLSATWQKRSVMLAHPPCVAAFSPDASVLALGSPSEESCLLLLAAGEWDETRAVYKNGPGGCRAAAFSPTGDCLVFSTVTDDYHMNQLRHRSGESRSKAWVLSERQRRTAGEVRT
jgi:hypothetical protein